ncbi:unnamed protein product [Paramecium sonneborni]|uniref:Uncharacterized protein n=1 Tax=Paramecium sonneborni TaxID=65129 RepID=A0A8S1PRV1_9CILI|nr:unnamed protein product [Paramecium sonneborni]
MLSCQESDHEYSEIIGVCLNNVCPKQGLCCFDCMKKFHSNHLFDTIKFKELYNWKKQKQLSLDSFKDNILQLQSFIVMLSDFIKETVVSSDFVENMNYTSLTKEIKRLLLIEQSEKSIMSKIADLVSQIPILKQSLKQLLFSKSQSQIPGDQTPKANECRPQSHPLISSGQYQERKIVLREIQTPISNQTVGQNYTLSKMCKHNDIVVDLDGKIANSSSFFKETRYIMCDQIITGNSIAALTINCGEGAEVGVCHQNIIFQKDKIYEQILDGAYILNNQGFVTYFTQKSKNNYFKCFGIKNNDIIKVEVDLKNQKIKWTNNTINEAFTLNIGGNIKELCFIVGLTSSALGQSTMKIIQEL